MGLDCKNCCACGSCVNICPKNAIIMENDVYGNLYPKVNNDNCIDCKLCDKVCPLNNSNYKRKDKSCYAAYINNDELLIKSSSGGIFASIAYDFLSDGGYVCGCASEFVDNEIKVHHIIIDNVDDLYKLQGSKYVQSNLTDVLCNIKDLLKENKKVLFSGTPCQVAGVKSFLRKKYDNLYTIDIICHGAPSFKFFNDYLNYVSNNKKIKINNFKFRNKENGWGLSGYLSGVKLSNNKKANVVFCNNESSYYYLFQKGYMYRKNCYNCIYACDNRPGDITIGDYWGIEKEHPEIQFDSKKGISCLIINNDNGEDLLKKYGNNISKILSSFEKIQRNNDQLQHPTIEPKGNDKLRELYKNYGYVAVEKEFVNIIGKRTLLKNKIKNRIKLLLKR